MEQHNGKANATPGGEISQALRALIDDGRLGARDMATRMRISPSYFKSLLNGSRPWSGLPPEALREVAKVIGCPPMRVMVAAGRVSLDDFLGEPHNEILESRFDEMTRHARLAAYAPSRSTWSRLPQEARQCFVLLFEAAKEKGEDASKQ